MCASLPSVSNKNEFCFGIEKQIIYLHAAIVRLALTPRSGRTSYLSLGKITQRVIASWYLANC